MVTGMTHTLHRGQSFVNPFDYEGRNAKCPIDAPRDVPLLCNHQNVRFFLENSPDGIVAEAPHLGDLSDGIVLYSETRYCRILFRNHGPYFLSSSALVPFALVSYIE